MKKNKVIVGGISGVVGVMLSTYIRLNYGADGSWIFLICGLITMIILMIYKILRKEYFQSVVVAVISIMTILVMIGIILDNAVIILSGMIFFYVISIALIIIKKKYYRD